MTLLAPLTAAVYQRLAADAGVTALGGVYEGEADAGAALPYVVIGEASEIPSPTFARSGWSDTVTLHLWAATRLGALDLLAAVDAALAAPLVLTGFGSAPLQREFTDVIVDPDGLRHVPARYRATAWAA